jgi:rhodanese-related sulfurtransferase
MMRNAVGFVLSLITLLVLGSSGCAAPAKLTAVDVPRMQVDELKARLGDPALVVIDVRQTGDWNAGSNKIKGAIREDFRSVSDWASNYPEDKTIVLYCTWPSEGTSASVARKLIEKGFTKVYALKGGWDAWEKAGYPIEPK